MGFTGGKEIFIWLKCLLLLDKLVDIKIILK